jgi:SulP family sulfate permease
MTLPSPARDPGEESALEASPDLPPLPPGVTSWLFQRVPALDALRQYSWTALGRDALAGLTVAMIAVPQAMAYATLAGLPPQVGLYTAIIMTAVGALLDSSRQLINGPTNAISIALLSALAVIPQDERISAAVGLAFLVGAVQLGFALLRLGDLTRFVSHSVIVGFTLGASVLLVLDQTKNLLGLPGRGSGADHFLERFWLSVTTGRVHVPTLLLGVGTMAIVLVVRLVNGLLRRRGSRLPIPQHLVAIVAMATLVWAWRLDERQGVEIVGAVPAAMPGFQLPDLPWPRIRLLAGNAVAIAILGLLEAVAMAKAIAGRTGQKLDLNQQCLSEGAANLAGSFFQCIPGSGSLTRSTVNQQAGAVSQWSGVFAAVAVAGMVLLFAPLARFIPRAALAGLLMLAAYRMVNPRQLLFHLRATRFDAGVVLVTALAAVLISVEFCIVIGVALSFVLYIPRAASVRLSQLTPTPDGQTRVRRPEDPPCPQLLLFDLEGELFFGVEAELEKHFAAIEKVARDRVRVVLLSLVRARNPDAVFLNLLAAFLAKLRARGVALILYGVQTDMTTALSATGLQGRFGADAIFLEGAEGTRAALSRAYALLGDDTCSACLRRQAPEWPSQGRVGTGGAAGALRRLGDETFPDRSRPGLDSERPPPSL